MAPFQNCPGIATLVPQYLIQDADIAENVLHVSTTTAWTSDLLTELANVYISWENTTTAGVLPKAMRSIQTSLQSVTCRDLTTETSAEVTVVPAGGPIVGVNASGPLSNMLTLSVKMGTGVPGRSFRGRLFWIGMAQNHLQPDTNFVVTTVGAQLVTAMTTLKNAIHSENANWNLCVLSRSHNLALRANGIGTTVTNASLVDGAIDGQSRRAPFHSSHH